MRRWAVLLIASALVACEPKPPPDDEAPDCSLPVEGTITLGMPVQAELQGDGWNLEQACTEETPDGPDHRWRLEIDQGATLWFEVTSALPGLVLQVREECDDVLTLWGCATSPAQRRLELVPGTYFVVVDGPPLEDGTGGGYTLLVEDYADHLQKEARPPLPHGQCEDALVLAELPTTQKLEIDRGGAPPYCLADEDPPPLEERDTYYYWATVPGGQALVVDGGEDFGVLFQEQSCRGPCFDHRVGGDVYPNPASFPVDVLAAVVVARDGDVRFQLVDLPENATCADAPTLVSGDVVDGVAGLGTTEGGLCPSLERPVYFHVDVPAGQVVTALLQSESATLTALDACGGACAEQESARLVRYNDGDVDAPWVLAVDRQTFSSAPSPLMPSFELEVDTRPPPAHARCADALAVADGDHLRFQHAGLATEDLAAHCLPEQTRGALFYRALIPDGETLTAVANDYVVYRVFAGCPVEGDECLAVAGLDLSPEGPGLTYTNTTGAAQEVVVAVSAQAHPAWGWLPPPEVFDLAIKIR